MTAVAIHITGYGESCKRAVHGVISNHKKVAQLHFIYPAYQSDEESMYPEWKEDRSALEKKDVKVFFNATLSAKYFDSEITRVIEINPYCELKLGAFEAIENAMQMTNNEQTHVVLDTATKLNTFSLWYGFLVVLTVMEWFWNRIAENNKLIQYTDVLARFIVRKGNSSTLPGPSFFWRLWNPHVKGKLHGGHTAVNSPPVDQEGYAYTSWVFYTHRNLRIGLWMFPFALFWFVWSTSWISGILSRTLVLGGYSAGTWTVEMIASWLICSHYLQIKGKWFFYILFPVYLALFPLFLIFCKMSTPQKTWS